MTPSAPPVTVTQPLRVVHVVTRSHHRGAEVVAVELAAALDNLGHSNEVHAIALAADGQSTPDLPVLVPSKSLGVLTYLRSSWRIRRHLAANPADLVLAHGGWAAMVVAFAVPSSSVRVWQRILGLPIERWGRFRRFGWHTVARRFDGVVALTADMESEMRELGYEGPVWLVANARDPGRFASLNRSDASARLRAQIGIDAEVPLLGFVGYLVDQKQPELAVDVLAHVRNQGHPAHLVIAGEGHRRAAVEQRISELGLDDVVTLLGHREDPELVFSAVDMALITSRAEGVPGVAIEAHMAGCPVVSFPVGAVGDVIQDGVTGVITAVPDVALMAERVSDLLARPDQLAAMGRASSAKAMQLTTANSAALYAALFGEMIAGAGDAAGDSSSHR